MNRQRRCRQAEKGGVRPREAEGSNGHVFSHSEKCQGSSDLLLLLRFPPLLGCQQPSGRSRNANRTRRSLAENPAMFKKFCFRFALFALSFQ